MYADSVDPDQMLLSVASALCLSALFEYVKKKTGFGVNHINMLLN